MVKNFIFGALVGATLGGAAAILYAPQSGQALRQTLRNQFGGVTRLQDTDVRAQLARWIDDGVSQLEAWRPELEPLVAEIVTAARSQIAPDGGIDLAPAEARAREWVDRGLRFLRSKADELRTRAT